MRSAATSSIRVLPQPGIAETTPIISSAISGPETEGWRTSGAGRGRTAPGRQQNRAELEARRVEADQNSGNTQQEAMEVEEKGEIASDGKEKLMDVVYFNCGEVGHYSTACGKPRCCFICRQEDHVVDKCPVWQKDQSVAQYYGSACKGLGFYHIDVEPREGRFSHWNGLHNFGILTIEQGDISEPEIIVHLKRLFDDKWDWVLRSEEDYTYIIRFPPHKRVENLIIGKATLFYLEGTNAVASLKPWNGDVEPISKMEELWVQVKGIPPKWNDWWTIKDVASSIGLLQEVDWTVLFSSYFATARIRIKCKNPARVPFERVYEFGGSCYLVYFKTEGVVQLEDSNDNDGGNDGEDGKRDDGEKEDEGGNGNDDNEDDIDPEDEDLLDDDPKEKEGQGKENGAGGSAQGSNQSNDKNKKLNQGSAKSKSHKGSKSVRRPLNFFGNCYAESIEHQRCVNLLQSMELESSDGEDVDSHLEEVVQEEFELSSLPLEWIENLSAQRKDQGLDGLVEDSNVNMQENSGIMCCDKEEATETVCTQPNIEDVVKAGLDINTKKVTEAGKKEIWGPILAKRKSNRIIDDGRSMMEKAQDCKRSHNLENGKDKFVAEYGYTTTQNSCYDSKLGAIVSCGEEGRFESKSVDDQEGGSPGAMAALTMTPETNLGNLVAMKRSLEEVSI